MKTFFSLFAALGLCVVYGLAQTHNPVMHSNIRGIKVYLDNGDEGVKEWSISPAANPDILNLYHPVKKSYSVKFVSDIDSLSFTVEVRKPVSFSIVYKGDTAHTKVQCTDRLPATMSDQEKLYALSLFWSEAKYNFAFADKLDFDMDSLYRAYIPMALETENDYAFYDVMRRFAGRFKDGHTNVNYYGSGIYQDYIPASVRYFNDDLYVVRVRKDLAENLPVGSKILTINGLQTADYMSKYVEPYIESDFEPTVRALATTSSSSVFAARPLTDTLTVTCQTPDNTVRTVVLPRDGEAKRHHAEDVGYIPNAVRRPPIEIAWQENGIAVLSFNTFDNRNGKLIELFEHIKDTLYAARGIVIDLRQNRGGTTDAAWHLLQYMVKDPYFLNYAWQTRINDGVKKANGNWRPEDEDYYKHRAYRTVSADTVFIPDGIRRFNVPMVVLISTMTVSAAEDFLIILYERPDRPLFIGQPSFGSTGSPSVLWRWPNNGSARICARRVLFPYSMKPFTEGIPPDIPVDYTFDEFMSEKDKEMEAAIIELQRQIANIPKIQQAYP